MDLLVETNVIILHRSPMPPSGSPISITSQASLILDLPECDQRWSAVHLKNFPRKCGHHPLECFVARGKVGSLRAIVVVGRNDCIISAHVEHMRRRLRRSTVYGECVVVFINCAPIIQVGLERRFYFPVFDKVLHKLWKTSCLMGSALGYNKSLGYMQPLRFRSGVRLIANEEIWQCLYQSRKLALGFYEKQQF